MAIIKSGASSDTLTIDATSKAARVTLYDTLGNCMGQKATYRAATTTSFAAAASTSPFFIMEGSATKTIRVQRVVISGLTLTAVAYASIQAKKHSTASSGGTPTALTQTPLDSGYAAGTANLCSVFTAAPTAGTLVGNLDAQRVLMQASTAAAAGIPPTIIFDFRCMGGETSAVVLRGTGQGFSLAFDAAPATAVTMSLYVEWTEE